MVLRCVTARNVERTEIMTQAANSTSSVDQTLSPLLGPPYHLQLCTSLKFNYLKGFVSQEAFWPSFGVIEYLV